MEKVIRIDENKFSFRGGNEIFISTAFDVVEHNDNLNKLTRSSFNCCLNDKFSFTYSCPTYINGSVYDRDYIVTSIVLHVIDTLNYYLEYNKFKSFSDCGDFSTSFGYDDVEKLLNVIEEITNMSKALKNKKAFDSDFISQMIEVYGDGDRELYKKTIKIEG